MRRNSTCKAEYVAIIKTLNYDHLKKVDFSIYGETTRWPSRKKKIS